jgi:type 1 glutamine amidotransferase/glyoxylase-like metal-dependent hydrolase (beta-lactamase superfamily II)
MRMRAVVRPLTGLALLLALPPASAEPFTPRELAPGIHALRSADRFGSANVGWAAVGDQLYLIGAPPAGLVPDWLSEAERTSGRRPRRAILTDLGPGAAETARALAAEKIEIVVPAGALKELGGESAAGGAPRAKSLPGFQEFTGRLALGAGDNRLEAIDLGTAAGGRHVVVHAPAGGVLFTGGLCVNGPRAELSGSDTEGWIAALLELEKLPVKTVVPGRGTLGGPQLLERQRRYLLELRRQVGYLVAQGVALERLRPQIVIQPEWLVWMPYDQPAAVDIDQVHRELTVPRAPFGLRSFAPGDARPRALALIGDRFHEPGHIESGLRPIFEAAGVQARFAVDVRALSEESLKPVQLLVVLRDGMIWPDGGEKPYRIWMTPEQERAVVAFVEAGGGLLSLHNSLGLYPEGGPYLGLLAGVYRGHGPLEEFRVKVVDPAHPITRGVSDYEIADEQHTPLADTTRVHLLLESRSERGVLAAAGWAREAGKGRVAHLANGHTRDSLTHPAYRRLLENAVRWCLRLEPSEGQAR